MYKYFVLICISTVFIYACNDSETSNHPLSLPPYNKITDSINNAPKDADLYFRRGSLLYSNNQNVFAENDFRKAWELQPKEEFAVGLTAVLKQKNVDTAITFLKEALNKLPNNVFLQIALARGYQQKKQPDNAIEICNKIINQFPNSIDALMLKAELLKEQNKHGEAIKALEQAYLYAPGDVELVHGLAFDYAESKNPKTLILSDSLIRADTEKSHAEPFYFKGVYYSNIGNNAEAIRQFDEAIRRNYNFMNAYINKGIIYYEQKKYADALKTLGLATTVSPDEADPYYWIGKTYEAMGKKDEARNNYQSALNLDKNMVEAKEGLGRVK